MLQGGKQQHALKAFLKVLTYKHQNAAVENSHLLPVLIIQRQIHKVKNDRHEREMHDYETADTPHYIWVEKGSILTPEAIYVRAYHSIRNALDLDKRREALDKDVTECFATQRFLKFGTTMNLLGAANPVTEEHPLVVRSWYQQIRRSSLAQRF
jgi:hypothetical protein